MDLFPHDIEFGREICGEPYLASQREWLVTNGIGGFACGTISGELTRRYHGLLVAAMEPPLGRTLLVTKFNEVAASAGVEYHLSTNRMRDGIGNPGCIHIQRFYLDGTTPVWEFSLGNALLEKRVWMEQGANTSNIQYSLLRGEDQIWLAIEILVNGRDYHGATTTTWNMQVDEVENGLRIIPGAHLAAYYILSQEGNFQPHNEWIEGYVLSVEQYRGFEGLESHLRCGDYHISLHPGESVTLVTCLDPQTDLDGKASTARRAAHEAKLLDAIRSADGNNQAATNRLVLAADQFVVQRMLSEGRVGHSVIAGYPWFGDWGRDTMISLPGLALVTGRPEVARSILETFAGFVDQGMLPNRFPDEGQPPEYNTVDATLWYFDAVWEYLEYVKGIGHIDEGLSLLQEIYPVLQEIVEWHLRGTRYNIRVDREDGLLYAGKPGVQLTWMDAKVGGWVVTPRIGKPVEISALWYNALNCMVDFSAQMGTPAGDYVALAEAAGSGFERIWNSDLGYCFDVIDGPDGNDASLRPNQLIAAALPYSPLDTKRARMVVDACTSHLLTPYGLRSLAPFEAGYQGHYGGDLRTRDAAYHQGTVWSWLIGPFVRAHLRAYEDKRLARSFLLPLVQHLGQHGLGSVSEIFDGDPPHSGRGCFAQGWGVSELLRAWIDTEA